MSSLYSRFSEVAGSEAGALCDSGQHRGANFFTIVEAEHIGAMHGVSQFYMGTFLRQDSPAFSQKCLAHDLGLRARPLAQADTGRTLIESGMSFDFSTSSATAYNASAYAFALASSTVVPYAIAPGTSGISAIHLPSVSRSISNWNRKSRLLTLVGGFLPVSISLRCCILGADARYGRNWVERTTIQRKPGQLKQNSANGGIQSGSGELLVLKVLRVNESQHRVTKQERVLAVVKSQRHSKLANLQALRLRQLSLPLVKRPKAVGFEFEGAGYVQAVEGAYAEFGAVAAGEVGAEVESVFWHADR